MSAYRDVSAGLIDADLGSGLIKQRVARPGAGKSGGHRILLAFRHRKMTVFLYAFAKNDKGNIDEGERDDWKSIAAEWLTADTGMIGKALAAGALIEVRDDGQA